MRLRPTEELPPERQKDLRRAKLLDGLTIAYLTSVVSIMFVVMGSSQAMKTAWVEDAISMIPSIVFLVSSPIRRRPPNARYPYGYHRAPTIAFLCAALTLVVIGVLLASDAALVLARGERPTIGAIELFGRDVWRGWLMLAALAYSAVPAVVLGLLKHPLSRRLHDKTLYADALVQKDDWLTATAAAVGVVGTGFGFWWVDAVAAGAISIAVLHDGSKSLRAVIGDICDRQPRTVDHAAVHPLPATLLTRVKQLGWVADAQVRMREHGHVLFGEISIVPRDERAPLERTDEVLELARGLDWRLHDLTVQLVAHLDDLD
jgi:cation diffusion facilitator family transporter